MISRSRHNFGFTLVETLVASAIFTLVAVGLYATYTRVLRVVHRAQMRVATTELGTELMEIVHNMPYASVGTKSGIPHGILDATSTYVRAGMTFVATTTVRYIDLPFDGLAPYDTNPADNKIVEYDLLCTSCTDGQQMSFVAQVGPHDLEASSTLGSLFVRTIDASGNPVPQATVHVVETAVAPAIDLTDVTMNNGMLQLVGAPPASKAYRVSVSKPGYSSDSTYAPTGPLTYHPVLPDATVATGTVTQLTFIIDKLSALNVTSVTPACSPLANVPFSIRGAKFIGTEPVYKTYRAATTNSSGQAQMANVEFDTYTATTSLANYDLVGVNPPSPFMLSPGVTQNLQFVLIPTTGDPNDNTLLVTVLDSVTGLPLSGANVEIQMSAQGDFNQTTGRGFLAQTDWSGGAGQDAVGSKARYAVDDGGVSVTDPSGAVTLKKVLGDYVNHGELVSSTFDTGIPSNFYQLLFSPTNQPASTTVRMQFATAASSTGPWNFLGPDGTPLTYYSASSSNIAITNNGGRYARYKLILDSSDPTQTPEVDDASFTFASMCAAPGQAYMQGLHNGSWTVTVSAPGYATAQQDVVMNTSKPWGQITFSLDPQ